MSFIEDDFKSTVFQGILKAMRDGQLHIDNVLSILENFEDEEGVIRAEVDSRDQDWLQACSTLIEEASNHVYHRNGPISIQLNVLNRNSSRTTPSAPSGMTGDDLQRSIIPMVIRNVDAESSLTEASHTNARQSIVRPLSYAAFHRMHSRPINSTSSLATIQRRRTRQQPSHTVQLVRFRTAPWDSRDEYRNVSNLEHEFLRRAQMNNTYNNHNDESPTVDETPLPSWANRERLPADQVPSEYVCPITQETMRDPVTASDGYSYEREAIERWLSQKNTSPITNAIMPNNNLVSNHVLRSLIDQHQQSNQPTSDE